MKQFFVAFCFLILGGCLGFFTMKFQGTGNDQQNTIQSTGWLITGARAVEVYEQVKEMKKEFWSLLKDNDNDTGNSLSGYYASLSYNTRWFDMEDGSMYFFGRAMKSLDTGSVNFFDESRVNITGLGIDFMIHSIAPYDQARYNLCIDFKTLHYYEDLIIHGTGYYPLNLSACYLTSFSGHQLKIDVHP